MMISVISFTGRGAELSLKLKAELERKNLTAEGVPVRADLYRKFRGGTEGSYSGISFVEGTLEAWTGEQFAAGRAILFIGSVGIAVRAAAPFVKSKLTDSPVIAADEKGRFVIPILSGHLGGANALAEGIADCLGAIPVITTATDLNDCFAVDLFAKENQLGILKKEGIAAVSGKLLSGEKATLSVQGLKPGCDAPPLPEGLLLCPYPPEGPWDIVISSEEAALATASCPLKPKLCAVGIGCKKGKSAPELEAFFLRGLEKAGIDPEDVFAIASIDKKKEEEGLCLLAEKRRIPFLTFSAEELKKAEGDFNGSAFVEERMGVDNVCERAAVLACREGGRLVLRKQAGEGMTLAAAEREWDPYRLNWEKGLPDEGTEGSR